MTTPRTASFIYSAIRTPFGRYGGALSGGTANQRGTRRRSTFGHFV